MDERLYSRPLDVHRISDYPEVQRMITYLFDEMKSSYDKPYFMQLWELMDAESKINQKELESIKKLEDLL